MLFLVQSASRHETVLKCLKGLVSWGSRRYYRPLNTLQQTNGTLFAVSTDSPAVVTSSTRTHARTHTHACVRAQRCTNLCLWRRPSTRSPPSEWQDSTKEQTETEREMDQCKNPFTFAVHSGAILHFIFCWSWHITMIIRTAYSNEQFKTAVS